MTSVLDCASGVLTDQEVLRSHPAVAPALAAGGALRPAHQGALDPGEGPTAQPPHPRPLAGGGEGGESYRHEEHRTDTHG